MQVLNASSVRRCLAWGAVAVLVAGCAGDPGTGADPSQGAADTGSRDETGPSATFEPSDSATLTIAVGTEPNSFDPGQTLGPQLNPTTFNVFETLFVIDDDGGLAPHLAKSYELSKDGLTATIKLKSAITFHDGTPFDASAVKFNIERAMDPASGNQQARYYSMIKSIDTPDERTVVLHLAHRSAVLPRSLTGTAAAIVSPPSLEQHGNTPDNYRHPVGTGPYQFDGAAPGESVTLTRFDHYWDTPPYYKTLTYRIVPEANTRQSLLLADQVDIVADPPYTDLESIESNPDLQLSVGGGRDIVVSINTQWPGLEDERVRHALNYAVDKEAAIKTIVQGFGEPMTTPGIPGDFGSCENELYDYDPDKASELLEQAGATDLKLKMATPTGRYPQDFQTAQVVANYLREVGVDVEVETMAWPTLLSKITTPLEEQTYPLQLLGYNGVGGDASTTLRQFTKGQWPPNGVGMNFYDDPTFERLYMQQDRIIDPRVREEKLCELAQLIWDAAPWIFLWMPSYPMAHQADIAGVTFANGYPDYFDLTEVHPS